MKKNLYELRHKLDAYLEDKPWLVAAVLVAMNIPVFIEWVKAVMKTFFAP